MEFFNPCTVLILIVWIFCLLFTAITKKNHIDYAVGMTVLIGIGYGLNYAMTHNR